MLRKVLLIFSIATFSLLLVFFYFFPSFSFHSLFSAAAPSSSSTVFSDDASNSVWWGNFLGILTPKNYLVLFLNNTELRPGGGFIGAYAVVTMRAGLPVIIKVEGTEIIDGQVDKNVLPIAPQPIADYVKIPKLYFRDSNWSPDFSVSASTTLSLYRLENGVLNNSIDAVIGFTPTVLENILRVTGPITVNDIEFTADNFTERLEYEVEYGYREKGKTFGQRKNLMGDLLRALIPHIQKSMFGGSWNEYRMLLERMVNEKHIMVFSPHPDWQNFFVEQGLSGSVIPENEQDYLLWVDANLGALKTDAALRRSLSYTIAPGAKGGLVGEAAMWYVHGGVKNWRTARYRSYVRVYVPEGAEFERAFTRDSNGREKPLPVAIDQGKELGKTWFGTFVTVDIGEQKNVVFRYTLPSQVVTMVQNGVYHLVVQKQLGTILPGLSLRLDFGKPVTAALPAEEVKQFGDNIYTITTDLARDREFEVSL